MYFAILGTKVLFFGGGGGHCLCLEPDLGSWFCNPFRGWEKHGNVTSDHKAYRFHQKTPKRMASRFTSLSVGCHCFCDFGTRRNFKRRAPDLGRWGAVPLSPHPFSSPPPSRGRQKGKGLVLWLFLSTCLSLLNAASPGPPRTKNCPQLIDKTRSALCCTHWHFWASQQSPLSLSACVQGLCGVRAAQVAVGAVYSLVTLVASYSFGIYLQRWLFLASPKPSRLRPIEGE